MGPLINDIWNKPWHTSVAAGVLLGLSFPPLNFPFLQFIAFILLFRLAESSRSGRELSLYAWPAFLVWNLFGTYWLLMATVAAGLAAITANALLMLLPLLLIRNYQLLNMNRWITALLAASTWTGYEFLHHHWELAWPWLSLANGWATMTGIIQYISWTGHLAVTFWVVFTSFLFYSYFTTRKRQYLAGTISLLLLAPLLSLLADASWQENPDPEPFEAAVVQHNIDSYRHLGGFGSADEIITLLLNQTREVITDETRLVIWPENAVNTSLSLDSPRIHRIRDSLRSWNTELITGTGFVEYYEDSGQEPAIVRRMADGRGYNVFNASLHITPHGQTPDVYKKGKLVPVVERLPYANFLKKLDIMNWVDWGLVTRYGRGDLANPFHVSGELTGGMVCYDSVFPYWVGNFVRNGATFLTIVTNDGWWGDSSGHTQHFEYARLRAIEYRRWVVRSANNGISGIISPDGEVLVETEYWTQAAFRHTIWPDERLTFYARYGNWFNFLMLLAAGAGVLLVLSRRKWQQRKVKTGY
ncbi:MAG: apolipoprotein N-acyltransferase [Balneolaceae bacterium]